MRFIFYLFILSFLIESCDEKNCNERILNDFKEDELGYFYELAFGLEFQKKEVYNLCLWTRNVNVELLGDYNYEDSIEVDRVIEELNHIIDPIEISIVEKNGNLKIYFIENILFNSYCKSTFNARGYFVVNWNRFFSSGFILIDKNQSNSVKKHLIREELAQALGLMNDSWKYEESIFYQGNNSVTEFSEMDKKMIALLYNYKLHFYMKDFEFKSCYIKE